MESERTAIVKFLRAQVATNKMLAAECSHGGHEKQEALERAQSFAWAADAIECGEHILPVYCADCRDTGGSSCPVCAGSGVRDGEKCSVCASSGQIACECFRGETFGRMAVGS